MPRPLPWLLALILMALAPPLAHGAPVFVDAQALAALQAKGATILDARPPWQYRDGHIPGAVNGPWHAFTAGRTSGELRPPAEVAARLRALGVHSDRPVVVYGLWHAAWGEEGRLFWMLEALGHRQVTVLQGGLAAWPGPLDRALAPPAPGDFTAHVDASKTISTAGLDAWRQAGGVAVLDVRTAEEFAGATPYGEARGGHVPGARSLPWKGAFDAQGALKPKAQVKAWLEAAGVRFDQPAVAYCTGGVRSGFVYLLLRWLDHPQPVNYAGSWWAWAADAARPVAKAP